MDVHNIPSEIVVALISGLYAFLIMLWSKMDRVWKAISIVREDYVKHDICEKRQDKCPCKSEITHLQIELSELKNKRK